MAVVDLAAWSHCLDVAEFDVGHVVGAAWGNGEELYHLARRQQIRLQDCPDLELVAAVRDVEEAQCRVLTRLDEVCQVVRREVG
jgi:hypothetical protein